MFVYLTQQVLVGIVPAESRSLGLGDCIPHWEGCSHRWIRYLHRSVQGRNRIRFLVQHQSKS